MAEPLEITVEGEGLVLPAAALCVHTVRVFEDEVGSFRPETLTTLHAPAHAALTAIP